MCYYIFVMKEIAKILQEARKEKGMTQTELGAKMGLPQSHISQIESGKVDIRVSSLLELARWLDLEPVMVPRILKPAVKSLISGEQKSLQKPAWQADEDYGEDELL